MTPFDPTERDTAAIHKIAFKMKGRGLSHDFVLNCVRYGLMYAEVFNLVVSWDYARSGWEQDNLVLSLMKKFRYIR